MEERPSVQAWPMKRMLIGIWLIGVLALPTGLSASSPATVHPEVWRQFPDQPAAARVKVWVRLADKGGTPAGAFEHAGLTPQEHARLTTRYSVRAVERRRLRRTRPGLFDTQDLPVDPRYMDAVAATGATLGTTSRWLNAVSATATAEQVKAIAALPFVRDILPVGRGRRNEPVLTQETTDAETLVQPTPTSTSALNYGPSLAQLNQIQAVALHDLGLTGTGVVLAVLDSGFYKDHESIDAARVIAEWDFVKNDGNTQNEPGDPTGQHDHGTKVLSVAAGRKDGMLYGPAYEADLILCKTEDISREVPIEEDWFVAGLEFAEAHGADVITSSLGYIDWYTQADLDGQTAVTTLAVNVATANGVVCCTAAGNAGGAGPSLIAPADAFDVITVGAVDSTGSVTSFSSRGPTADGRVKPEVVARGLSTWGASASGVGSYAGGSGTSFATPLVAGVVACLLQDRPDSSVQQVRDALCNTADFYVSHGMADPANARGYGLVNALAAWRVPSIVGAVSRREHGAVGSLDLDLHAPAAIEPRAGGPLQLVITFDQPIQQITGTPADVRLSTGTVSALHVQSDSLVIDLTGSTNAAPLVVSFPGIAHAQEPISRVTDTLCMGVLAGDVNGDAMVNVFDLVAVRNALNGPVVQETYKADVTADGAINIFDLVTVRNHLNTAVAPCP